MQTRQTQLQKPKEQIQNTKYSSGSAVFFTNTKKRQTQIQRKYKYNQKETNTNINTEKYKMLMGALRRKTGLYGNFSH